MNARTLEREEGAAVRLAMARTARGHGSAVALTGTDATELLAQAALTASAAGWTTVEVHPVRGGEPLTDLVAQLTAGHPELLTGTGRPLADWAAGRTRDPHDLAFALLATVDRVPGPVLLLLHDLGGAGTLTPTVLALLAGQLHRTPCVLVHPGWPDDRLRDAPSPTTDATLLEADDVVGCPPRLAEGERRFTLALARARSRSSSRDFGLAAAWRGIVRSRAGVCSDALPDLVAGVAHGADDDPLRSSLLGAALVDCRLAVGDLHAAGAHRRELLRLAARTDHAAAVAMHALAELAAASADHVTAFADYTAVGALAGDDHPLPMSWRRGAAISALHLGRPAEARRLAVADLEAARSCTAPDTLAQALRTLAATDPGPRSAVLLEEGREVLAGAWFPRLSAQIDTDLAGLLVLSGRDTSRAVALLRGAERFAAEQRLAPLVRRVQRVLAHLGEAPTEAPLPRAERLGVVERQAAVLAATGLDDVAIAERMMTTVTEAHEAVRQASRVLGVRSRSRLAAALGDGPPQGAGMAT
jgi:DNA-binding NarL/FixJ family response regulator